MVDGWCRSAEFTSISCSLRALFGIEFVCQKAQYKRNPRDPSISTYCSEDSVGGPLVRLRQAQVQHHTSREVQNRLPDYLRVCSPCRYNDNLVHVRRERQCLYKTAPSRCPQPSFGEATGYDRSKRAGRGHGHNGRLGLHNRWL